MYLIAVCAIISWQECFAVLLLVPLWLKTCFCSQVVFDIYQQELTRQTLTLLNGWVFIHMQILEREQIWWTQKKVQSYSHLRVKKAYTSNTTLLPVAPDDILRSYEVKQSVIERKWALFTTLLPVIQSLRQTVRSEVRLTNKSLFRTSYFWWTSLTCSPNRTEASETVQGSNSTDLHVFQSKLTFRHAWQSLWLEIIQNTAYMIPWCWFLLIQRSSSSNSHWTEELRTKTNEPLICKFLWFLMVYVKSWADED